MGTSHRYTPTVKGEPNWGKASSAISGLANNVIEYDDLDNNPPINLTPEQIVKRKSLIGSRIVKNYHHSIRNLVRAAGGRQKVVKGESRAIGHAGLLIAGKFISAVGEIIDNGLENWLQQQGILSLNNLQRNDILAILRRYAQADVVGLDETAANEALEYLLDCFDAEMDDDLSGYDDIMNQVVNSETVKDLLDSFFGMYIYSLLSQSFEEKLEYEKGTQAMTDALQEIKDQILDDIHIAKAGRDIATIDWSKPEGLAFIESEFNRILYILQGNED